MAASGVTQLWSLGLYILLYTFFSRIDDKKTEAATFDVRQPSFITEDGHLIIISGSDRNVTLRTSGRGYVNINGENIVNLVSLARNASEMVERKLATLAELEMTVKQLSRAVEGPLGLRKRMARLERGMLQNGTSGFSTSGGLRPPRAQLRNLRNRVSSLEAQVRRLKLQLATNECASNPCRNGGTCEDTFKAFVCRCPNNWEGTLCETDVNECSHFIGTDLGCQNGATCVNKPGTYECTCPPGWFGLHCTQRSNDCSKASSLELCGNGVCVSQSGTAGYTCICNQGWTTESNSKTCTKDVDECASNSPPCSRSPLVECINVPGSFFCARCPAGFTGNGYYCTDINECMENNGGCSQLVQCVNTFGSRVCSSCPPGYQGNGEMCTYAGGACKTNNGGCHPLATCQDNPAISSSYVLCSCPVGYTGSGVGPLGCSLSNVFPTGNPCASNPCVRGACSQVGDGYTCRCFTGFSGVNCDQNTDPCSSSPCKNGGTCVRQAGPSRGSNRLADTFRCRCAKGFSGFTCSTQVQACGGMRIEDSGTIQFPTSTGTYQHSLNCAWVITVNTSQVVNVTFRSFSLESSADCLFDWLQIHDGRSSGEQLIGRFCGNALPKNGNIISTTNALYLWFRSDKSSNHDGFELDWNATNPVCGGTIDVVSHGRLESPGSPGKYPPNRDCFWILNGPVGKRLQFHFYTLMIASSSNCSQDWLQIHDGISPTDTVIVKFCNSSHPQPITIPGPTAVIHFHSDAAGSDNGFQLTYTVVESFPGCGGVLTEPTGDIVSPRDTDDKGYKKSLDCEWKIQVAENERIALSFESFHLESSASCSFDYLEIRDGKDQNAPLVGRYCGTTSPRTYKSLTNTVFLRFRTDFSLSGDGFRIKYKMLCGGTFESPEGIIHSPLYPNPYPNSRTCEYIIKQPLNKAIKLHFLDFDMEDTSYPNCLFDFLEVRDGDNENSTLVGRYCGESESLIPPDVISTHNFLWLQFVTDSSDRNRGFKANYTTIDLSCGGIITAAMGVITSPSYPDSYPNDIVCSWVIVAPPGFVVQLQFVSMSLEGHSECKNDYIEVFDNSSTPNFGGSFGRYCSGIPPTLTSSDRTMTIRFQTDHSVTREGFTARFFTFDASKMCGGNLFTAAGAIQTPNYPVQYPEDKDCTWIINAPTGQQVMLNITDFHLEKHDNCKFDFLEIRNGALETSPLIGLFCGEDIPRQIPSMTNHMYLRFKTDGSRSDKGFRITWDSMATGCGGTLTAPSGSIMSPNYPQPYAKNALCFWKIVVNMGSKIQVTFNDLDLEEHMKCNMDYIEFLDGADGSSPIIGRYCTSHPPTIITTSNQMYLKFRSDLSQQGRGFHIRYDTLCSTSLTGHYGVIESPNFPRSYPSGRDCTWKIEALAGNKVNLTFSHFLMENGTDDASGSIVENCRFDYVEISEGAINSEATTIIGRFCGTTLPPTIHSTKEHVYVHFVTDTSVSDQGFRLEWVVNGCGGRLTHPYGQFMSPGYPGVYPESVECEWLIVLEPDQSVQLNISDIALERSRTECGYDGLKVFGGPDKTSPVLGSYCHNHANISLTSSSNYMLVRFYSDFSYSGRGFKAIYGPVPSLCGGKFVSPSGTIHSRNYPKNYENSDDCQYLIEVDQNHVVRLTFTSFDVEAHQNCTMDYVRVFDGDSATAPKLIDHCGNTLPTPSEVVSTGNKLLVRFKSDGTVSAKGFMANYSISCGARIVTEDSGVIQTLDSISVYSNMQYSLNCSWVIIGAKPEDRVTLTILHIDVSSGDEEPESCEYYQIDIHDGDDLSSPLMGSYCGNKAPPHLTSRGNAMVVNLVSKFGGHFGKFAATYSVLTGACGGELTSEHGSFASPNYPDNYPPSAECIWIISTSPGNKAMISFVTFDLEQSDFCDGDYVEVREVDSVGPLIGVYCSNTLPGNVTAANKLWVKFKSNGEGNGKGFLADYSLLHGNEITGLRGEIASPLYPREYIQSGEFFWRVTVEFGKAIAVTIKFFYMEKYGSTCNTFLAVYDGYDNSAPELVKLCEAGQLPDPFTSTTNVVYIRLEADPMREGTKFLLEWMQVDRVKVDNSQSRTNASGCDAIIDLMQRNTTEPYRLTSPGFPHGYGDRLDCEWVFQTEPGSHIGLSFRTMDLEQSSLCNMDYVSTFQGQNNAPKWEPLKTFCLPNATSEYVNSDTSLMKVNFHTDSLKNESGFEAIVYSGCGGQLFDTNGVIEVTNKTKSTEPFYGSTVLQCRWNITVRTGRKIAVTFTRFELFQTNTVTASCSNNIYLMLKNGHGDDSPLLGQGKFCGSSLPEVPETSGNKLFIKLNAIHGNKGFRLQYQEVSQSCGSTTKLEMSPSQPNPFVVISSPNYPNIPPPHIECTWVIVAPAGERLHIDFIDRFDLTYSRGCSQAAVELRDGGTQLSQPIGRPFCTDAPSSQYTTGNYLYVRFFTDVNDPKDGFKANVSLASCGGTVRSGSGFIQYPKGRERYEDGVDCQWRIVGPTGTYLNLQFEKLDIYRVWNNCTEADYITISEIVPGNDTGSFKNDLGTFCRMGPSNTTIQTSGNEALISFHSVHKSQRRAFTGFKLSFSSSRGVCGGLLNTPDGVFQSPGYGSSGAFINRFCKWAITVPAGRRITVKFLDFDLEPLSAMYSQSLLFFNHHDYKSRITIYNSTSIPRPVKSSGNTMLIHFWVRRNIGHRGFKASYSSDEPTLCTGDFNQSSGVIVSPQTENNSFTFYCEWEHSRRGNLNETLTMLVNGSIGNGVNQCDRSQSVVSVTTQQGKLRLGDVCGNYTAPFTIRSPFPVTKLEAISGVWHGQVLFTLKYKTSPCGGILSGPEEVVTSPGFPSNYPPDTDCAWAVEFPPEQVIKVHFVTLDLDDACDKDYVIIYNGPTPKSPMIGRFCSNIKPQDFRTQSNKMWIDFHSDSSGQKSGFKLALEPVVFGCGGIFHGKNGELFSPEYPAQYPNNVECEWEVRVSDGYRIQFNFIERFSLETSNGCENDFIKVYDYSAKDGGWQELGRFCGRNTPDTQNSTGARMKILFRSNGQTPGDGFKARWSVNCGGVIEVESEGRIVSPGYPDEYSGNLKCNYTILAPGKRLSTKFTSFSLEKGYGTDCRYDNLTVYGLQHYWSRSPLALGTYCGTNKPPDRIFKDKVTLDFRSDLYVQRKGFVMEYSLDSCGGYINSPTSISAATNPEDLYFNINCTWIIEAPPGRVIGIRFSLFDLAYNHECRGEAVAVYEGSTINKTALIGKYCGNMTVNPPVVKSQTNKAVIMFTLGNRRQKYALTADIVFTLGEGAGCGGNVAVGPSTTTVRAPMRKGVSLYEPFADCHWLLTAPEGQNVRLVLTDLSVAPCFNKTFNSSLGCSCDYVEIRDGRNQFADLVGRYCGEKPINPITSSSSQMWLRFSSDGVNEAPGFTASLTSVMSSCGVRSFNVTNTTQVLASPGWPDSYPPNLRCRWQLTAQRYSRITVHFEEINLNPSDDCSDRLTLMDTGSPYVIADTSGESDVTFTGQKNALISIYRGSRSPTTAVHFCGNSMPLDYYSETNSVVVTFASNHEHVAKGFKLRISVATCTRNYTAPQGRILVERLPERCYIVVSAAKNHTIALYFSGFQILSVPDCATRAMEVRDGDSGDAPLLGKFCGYENPSPIFSTRNKIYIHTWRRDEQSYEHFDITYITTDKGRGCGGRLFNYGGTFTSPLYPNNIRNVSVCRWDVSVPFGLVPVIQFSVFDLGPKTTCSTDYVEVIDVDTTTNVEAVRSRYCGEDVPTMYKSDTNTVAIRYTRSVHNGGTGWVIRFMGLPPDAPVPSH